MIVIFETANGWLLRELTGQEIVREDSYNTASTFHGDEPLIEHLQKILERKAKKNEQSE